MKRTPIKRRTPLSNGKREFPGLHRSPLPKRNAKRRARLEARNFGPHARWVRSLPCHTCKRPPRSQASHAKPRGMGGCGGDRKELFPQCAKCHRLYEEGKLLRRDEARAIAAGYWTLSPCNPANRKVA